ncbi:uncharacterized protein KGF55_003703 [Candida pseudojiufengensis]|uniref:uncharacterized protein n=1 Tax=Candida pseudojiufengensis TaxID=497109 RepID=UPI002224FBBA|nr:uncharacterized protein KGF55_003703 [Candida pseudojiufengensis]KAI5962627.1 hypothetical protein KGF55_003703 [Candida pseudojiufengensis]
MINEGEIISKVFLAIDKAKGNITSFKKSISDGEYTKIKQPSTFSRLLIWKSILILDTLKISTWESKLNDSRIVFHQLIMRDDMRIPWFELDEDCQYYQTQDIKRKSSINRKSSLRGTKSLKKASFREQVSEDPLNFKKLTKEMEKHSLVNENLELLQIIILDIDRLFPGDLFFSESNNSNLLYIKKQLIEILYVWCKCNITIGYKQGFHEILGLIYKNLYMESINFDLNDPKNIKYSNEELAILSLYNKNFLCHDLFIIFNKFMLSSGILSNFYETEIKLTKSIELFNINLMKIDQFIYYTLTTKLKLDTQLWIIRYLRLLLSRELGNDMEITNLLWDKLISSQGSESKESSSRIPQLLMFITIILLIQQKMDLVTSDFSECLSLLLHYPIIQFKSPSKRDSYIKNLFKDAEKLYEKRNDDLKLYELGNKLNLKYNPSLKISMNYHKNNNDLSDTNSNNSARSSIDSASSVKKQQQQPPQNQPKNDRHEQMKFEKTRLEMKLKKKAQSLMQNGKSIENINSNDKS